MKNHKDTLKTLTQNKTEQYHKNNIEAKVGILMGSKFDWEIMEHTELTLGILAIQREVKIICPNRTPELLLEYCQSVSEKNIQVIIAGNRGAAHLPSMLATYTHIPILGVPIPTEALNGLDALLSIVQMTAGIPVGTLAIGREGAINAALLAAQILGLNNPRIKDAVIEYRAAQSKKIKDIQL